MPILESALVKTTHPLRNKITKSKDKNKKLKFFSYSSLCYVEDINGILEGYKFILGFKIKIAFISLVNKHL